VIIQLKAQKSRSLTCRLVPTWKGITSFDADGELHGLSTFTYCAIGRSAARKVANGPAISLSTDREFSQYVQPISTLKRLLYQLRGYSICPTCSKLLLFALFLGDPPVLPQLIPSPKPLKGPPESGPKTFKSPLFPAFLLTLMVISRGTSSLLQSIFCIHSFLQ